MPSGESNPACVGNQGRSAASGEAYSSRALAFHGNTRRVRSDYFDHCIAPACFRLRLSVWFSRLSYASCTLQGPSVAGYVQLGWGHRDRLSTGQTGDLLKGPYKNNFPHFHQFCQRNPLQLREVVYLRTLSSDPRYIPLGLVREMGL